MTLRTFTKAASVFCILIGFFNLGLYAIEGELASLLSGLFSVFVGGAIWTLLDD